MSSIAMQPTATMLYDHITDLANLLLDAGTGAASLRGSTSDERDRLHADQIATTLDAAMIELRIIATEVDLALAQLSERLAER
jgi:hypothetical protein